MVTSITGRSAVVIWTIPYVAFTFEQYRLNYGSNSDVLSMMSETLYGTDLDATNATYAVTLSELNPLFTYYIQVLSTNSEFMSSTSIYNFTTGGDGKVVILIIKVS